jgi:bifunctional NMN adenylyltransferase/nudix hydrolase
MNESNEKIGAIIGRFQDEDLHLGHRHLIDAVMRRHARCVIILGVNPGMPTERNPMGFEPRYWMIKDKYPQMPVVFVDDRKSDQKWSLAIDAAIESVHGSGPAILYGSPKDNSLGSYSGAHSTEEIPALGTFSGTEARAKLEDLPTSRDFRRGLILAARGRFPTAYPAVDAALWRVENSVAEVLLGRKADEDEWRFPGGFVDPADQCLEDAVRRELTEETMRSPGDYQFGKPVYVASHKVDDWRYRGSRDGIVTSLWACAFQQGRRPVANDDLEAVAFYSLAEASKVVAAEHAPLLRHLEQWFADGKNFK